MDLQKLKGRIVEKNLTQTKLAEKMGISIQSLNAKLNGRSPFNLQDVIILSKELKIEDKANFFLSFQSQICNEKRT